MFDTEEVIFAFSHSPFPNLAVFSQRINNSNPQWEIFIWKRVWDLVIDSVLQCYESLRGCNWAQNRQTETHHINETKCTHSAPIWSELHCLLSCWAIFTRPLSRVHRAAGWRRTPSASQHGTLPSSPFLGMAAQQLAGLELPLCWLHDTHFKSLWQQGGTK